MIVFLEARYDSISRVMLTVLSRLAGFVAFMVNATWGLSICDK